MNPNNQAFFETFFYQVPDAALKIVVLHARNTLWLNQRRLAALFGVDRTAIIRHFQNIFITAELDEQAVCAPFAQTGLDGKTYPIRFYNLDAIIAVGYRINSKKATQFRLWAYQVLSGFTIKGFVLENDRAQAVTSPGKSYFDNLRDRIRAIRTSEKQCYQKITAIYEECSIDYAQDAVITKEFFRTVQNKLHWAVTGKTAAQIIAERAKATVRHMGLQTWKNAPIGKIVKSDVNIAKNYLAEKEMKALRRIVTMYLYYAENQAARQIPMKMQDWIDKLDSFLQFNEYKVLKDTGAITPEAAKQLAEDEYQQYKTALLLNP
ncbi:cell filamentation protein Fic [Paraflavitalea soli]|uniref:Cell filamentation protein Fic n=1 Tax=Paraflavitalea soli TaxID=2315862 RepID=A0A3B7MVF7_9BACT|nr:RhuM family protein [Paraflavitalea soli]AXY78078.1 cell filamentation protein Fic [Paraflavitalea soli]